MRSAFGQGLGVALAIGAASALPAAPASAQVGAEATVQGVAAARLPSFTKEERTTLRALDAALTARNYAAAAAALTAAQAVARGSDARFHLASMQLRLGRETGNNVMQSQAVDALIASDLTPTSELPALYLAQAALATGPQSRQRSEAALTRALEASPTAETALALSAVKLDLRKNAEAVALIDRAIALRKATGQPVPESWYRRGAALASINSLPAQSLRFTRDLATAYPSPENWRDAVLTYRDIAKPDPQARLDLVRLARLAKGLGGERDYLDAAQTFDAAGIASESKSVLDEGVAARMVDPAKATFKEALTAATRKAAADRPKLAGLQATALAAPTGAPALQAGDMFLGSGNYAVAAELFRAALQKGGVDAGTANIRLGTALALAGRKAEAEAAFRAVAGARADLAALWLAWLAQRG